MVTELPFEQLPMESTLPLRTKNISVERSSKSFQSTGTMSSPHQIAMPKKGYFSSKSSTTSSAASTPMSPISPLSLTSPKTPVSSRAHEEPGQSRNVFTPKRPYSPLTSSFASLSHGGQNSKLEKTSRSARASFDMDDGFMK